jgi:hypothetical protein
MRIYFFRLAAFLDLPQVIHVVTRAGLKGDLHRDFAAFRVHAGARQRVRAGDFV